MKKLLLIGILFLGVSASYSQNMYYSFNGTLSEENSIQLIKELESLNYFTEIKIDLKANSGRLFFTIPSSMNAESTSQYTTSSVKSILVNWGLSPVNCEERN